MGRVAMLCVLVILAYLYLSAGVHLLSTWLQARNESAKVVAMQRENTDSSGASTKRWAGSRRSKRRRERLGMMKHGEQPYIISGLPPN